MENNVMNDEMLENVAGGTNTTNPNGAHWQATGYAMGTYFMLNGMKWYRIKTGDTLGQIAKDNHTTVAQLQAWNKLTITNPGMIFAGDAIIVALK